MAKKKSTPAQVQVQAEAIKICDLCGKPIKKDEIYSKHGKGQVHDKCQSNVFKYGKINP